MTKRLLAILAALAALALGAHTASAQTRERIVDFHSEVWINSDASLTVRETLTVDSARRNIKRGIFRDFPTTYQDRTGRRTVVGFDVQEITRNGRREPYRTERRSNGIRIYIGQENVIIPVGRHTYRITYRTDRQLGFYEDFDELFWNVTGNGWEFPIERARATVHLPAGAIPLERAGYTGREGERGEDYVSAVQSDRTISFESTRLLGPREGLTIAVSWPVGFVARPSEHERFAYFLNDNRVAVAGAIGLVILVIYYSAIWWKVGRDPHAGPIVPRYGPPDGLSPAGARYVSQMGFDDKAFTAAIVSLAVKGFLTIKEGAARSFSLERTGEAADLSRGEAAVVSKLFPGSAQRIELEQANHEVLQSAKKTLRQALRTEFEKTYFVRNTRYFVPGIAVTLLTVLALVVVSDAPEITAFVSVWLTFWTAGVYYLVRRVWRSWRAALAGGGIAAKIQAVFISLFSLPFIGGEIIGLGFFAEATSLRAAAVLVLLQLANVVFYHLLKAPTHLGRRVMDDIDGFKEYLAIAEKDRMNFLNPPERTPELFERFLPYALALGVEQQWAEQFSGVLTRSSLDPDRHGHDYAPRWYSGRHFKNGFTGSVASLSGGFTSTISAASTAPGSSSGSGGGGSSGGGGGGGGGGGW